MGRRFSNLSVCFFISYHFPTLIPHVLASVFFLITHFFPFPLSRITTTARGPPLLYIFSFLFVTSISGRFACQHYQTERYRQPRGYEAGRYTRLGIFCFFNVVFFGGYAGSSSSSTDAPAAFPYDEM
ncbi:hypothetical protein P153DRAFT_93604 [Dothidotthia symphoricarpi CBS 119687]|uniref:Uncharacterized protein n=1 Tax=Dothidotthia symphoricarpi CBS 119687 TaxID=1392245 RepID=A0A6A6A4E0_9PLEO|nr:uncharacterized protein P153DRAFT_93604 [Dothidotthia symphoricarpi CBS 119687]KAF2125777.1 hypothetical protein P153DRAFT_93604 [Dothidotthia symphoricarpi CBS 119687]